MWSNSTSRGQWGESRTRRTGSNDLSKVKRIETVLPFDEEVPEIFEHPEKKVLMSERTLVHWLVQQWVRMSTIWVMGKGWICCHIEVWRERTYSEVTLLFGLICRVSYNSKCCKLSNKNWLVMANSDSWAVPGSGTILCGLFEIYV